MEKSNSAAIRKILFDTEYESKIDRINNPGKVMQQMAVLLAVLLTVLLAVLIQK